MASKYPTMELIGVKLVQNENGKRQLSHQPLTSADFHSWRIGKHTKGRVGQPGQIFLTEQNFEIVLVDTKPLSFKDRHTVTPMGRFTKEQVTPELINTLKQEYQAIKH